MDNVNGHQRDEHEEAPPEGEEHELDGGVDPVGVAPDPDQKEHRDELDLPEEIEEQEVRGHEDPHQAAFQKQQEEVEGSYVEGDGPPGDQNADDVDEGREPDEHQAQPVQGETEAGPQAFQPGVVHHQEPGPRRAQVRLEVNQKQQADQRQFDDGNAQADPAAEERLVAGGKSQENPRQGGKKQNPQKGPRRHQNPSLP